MRLDDPPTDGQSHPGAMRFCGEECFENAIGLIDRKARFPNHSPKPRADHARTSSMRWSVHHRSLCIASMPLSMRFIKTCCSCTRSAVVVGSPGSSSVRIEIDCRSAVSPSKTIISRRISLMSTTSRAGVPRPVKRANSVDDAGGARHRRDHSGGSAACFRHIGSHHDEAIACKRWRSMMAAAIGCLIS